MKNSFFFLVDSRLSANMPDKHFIWRTTMSVTLEARDGVN